MSGRILTPGAAAAARVDLLPEWFRNRQRGRRICANWVTASVGITILLGCFSLASWMRVKREQQYRQQMAAKAEPILAAQQRCGRWEQQSERRERWCQWVESARPDDALLQTLASVAAVCRSEPGAVVLEAIHIRLPLEASLSDSATANASPTTVPEASGIVSVIGRVESPEIALRLAERLDARERFEAAQVKAIPDGDAASLRLGATPVAERVVP